MWRPSHRIAGPLLGLSALCLLIATVPLEVWPAPQPGDSYVFTPPAFTAIWMQRTAQPILTIGANVLILIGLGALFRRDSTSMSSLQFMSGISTLLGIGIYLLGSLLVTTAGPNEIINSLFGMLGRGIGLMLILPGLVGWGVSYLRRDNLRLGITLTGTPLLTCTYFGISMYGVQFAPIDGLLLITPTSAMALVVGYDLWVDSAVHPVNVNQSNS